MFYTGAPASYPYQMSSFSDNDWIPSFNERSTIDGWFQSLDDGSGFIGGANIVKFLKTTNLSKESLRTIWALVDSVGLGKVDRMQFYKIIRLVSIASSPIYAGSTPSLERYYATTRDVFPLPASLHMVPVAALSQDWIPSIDDLGAMNSWFDALRVQGEDSIGGIAAAKFLQYFNCPRQILRAIWDAVDQEKRGKVDRTQFYRIIRLVALSIMYPSEQPTLQRYFETARDLIPFPSLAHTLPSSTATPLPTAPVVDAYTGASVLGQGHSIQHLNQYDEYGNVKYLVGPPPFLAQQQLQQLLTVPISTPSILTAVPPQPSVHQIPSISLVPATAPPQDVIATLGATTDDAVNDDDFTDFESAAPMPTPQETQILPAEPDSSGSLVTMSSTSSTALNEDTFERTRLAPAPIIPSISPSLMMSILREDPLMRVAAGSNEHGDVHLQSKTMSPPLTVMSTAGAASEDLLGPPVEYTSSLGAPNERMHYLDALAEMDIIAQTEEWEDFAEGTDSSSAVMGSGDSANTEDAMLHAIGGAPAVVSGIEVPAHTQIRDMAAFEFSSDQPGEAEKVDLFADFQAAPISAPIEITTSSELGDSMIPAGAPTSDFEFGDFSSHDSANDLLSHNTAPAILSAFLVPSLAGEILPSAPKSIDTMDDDMFGIFSAPASNSETSETSSKLSKSLSTDGILFDLSSPLDISIPAPQAVNATAGTPQPGSLCSSVVSPFLPSSSFSFNALPVSISQLPSSAPPGAIFKQHSTPEKDDITPSSYNSELLDNAFGSPSYLAVSVNRTTPSDTQSEPEYHFPIDEDILGTDTDFQSLSYPLGSSQLEKVSQILSDRFFYFEASACLQQAISRSFIDDLNDRKKKAIEADDLERGVALKKEIAIETEKLESTAKEAAWIAICQSGRKGLSIEGLAKDVTSLNNDIGTTCRDRYLPKHHIPALDNAERLQRLQLKAVARRSLDMVIASYTTHSSLPALWSRLLTLASAQLHTSQRSLSAFEKLSSADKQAAVMASKKVLPTFLYGTLRLAEAAIIIASSCLEAMRCEEAATNIAIQAKQAAADAKTIWKNNVDALSSAATSSDLPDKISRLTETSLTVTELSSAAVSRGTRIAGLAAVASSPQDWLCRLTLRPISGLGDVCVLNIEGETYIESVYKLWKHHSSLTASSASTPNNQPSSFANFEPMTTNRERVIR